MGVTWLESKNGCAALARPILSAMPVGLCGVGFQCREKLREVRREVDHYRPKAEAEALYSYSFGTAQIITNRSSFDRFLYWCFSLGRTRAKSPFSIFCSSPLSVTSAPRPSIT